MTFPDPDTGEVKTLLTQRIVQTVDFELDMDEWDFYDALTRYVEDQSIKASSDDSARGRAVGFTMAMLQRRFASSVYAVRRTLERMRDRRERILEDPERYRQEQIPRRLPDDFEDMEDAEREKILSRLEQIVISPDPADLREEIVELTQLINQAKELESREVESKLTKLRETLKIQGVFDDPKMNGLYRAQGHPRLPGLQAHRLGAVGDPDTRRDEDRRSQHAWHPHPCGTRFPREVSGPGSHGGCW